MKKEVRYLPLFEIPALEIRDRKATGLAAVFNSDSHDLGGFIERIAPGAFTRSLAAAARGDINIYALWSHDSSIPLASTRSGKLALRETEAGLEIEMDVGRMTDAMRSALEDGDLQQSFGFSVREQEFKELEDGTLVRTLVDVDLSEISLVISPAYPDTTVALRSLEEWRSTAAEEVAEFKKEAVERDIAAANQLSLMAMRAELAARGVR